MFFRLSQNWSHHEKALDQRYPMPGIASDCANARLQSQSDV
jgi:hypothetical protein